MSDRTFGELTELIRDTLALDPEEPITPEQLLFYDLEFTSMDLLDLLFRIEEHFGVTIREGTLRSLAQGDLPAAEFEVDGVLTEEGRRRLMALLHDTPAEVFPPRIHTMTLPRYASAGAFARLVEHRLAEEGKGEGGGFGGEGV